VGGVVSVVEQYSVLGTQYSVLSTQYSVLNESRRKRIVFVAA